MQTFGTHGQKGTRARGSITGRDHGQRSQVANRRDLSPGQPADRETEIQRRGDGQGATGCRLTWSWTMSAHLLQRDRAKQVLPDPYPAALANQDRAGHTKSLLTESEKQKYFVEHLTQGFYGPTQKPAMKPTRSPSRRVFDRG